MDNLRLLNLEKRAMARRSTIFRRFLWEKDGDLFSMHLQRKGARPMSSREIDELEAELYADPNDRSDREATDESFGYPGERELQHHRPVGHSPDDPIGLPTAPGFRSVLL